MIDTRKLKQLIELMKENDLTELDLREGEEQVTIKRGSTAAPMPQAMAAPPAAQPAAAAPVAEPTPPTAEDQGLIEIKSPMVGTFYSAASPDADPYVRVGATIDSETVICLIEAMKVFNEIKAETSGTVEKVLVDNGQAVEYDQPLYLVKPQ